jgi:hypothetical protein
VGGKLNAVRYGLAVVLDCLLIITLGTAVFILATGGGAFRVGRLLVSARSPDNLLLFVAAILAARYTIREIPWLAIWPSPTRTGASARRVRR